MCAGSPDRSRAILTSNFSAEKSPVKDRAPQSRFDERNKKCPRIRGPWARCALKPEWERNLRHAWLPAFPALFEQIVFGFATLAGLASHVVYPALPTFVAAASLR